MTRIFTEDFEGGSDGAAVTTSNSGFDVITAGSTFTNSDPAEGALSALCSVTTSANRIMQLSSTTLGTLSALGASLYVELPDLPGSNLYVLAVNSGGTARADLRINAAGTVACRNGTTAVHTSSLALSADTKYRIEWLVDNTNSRQRFRIFSQHGTTALYDSGDVTYNSGTFNTFLTGIAVAATNSSAKIAWVALDDATWPGPAVASNAAPTADAGVDQVDIEPGATVTLSGSDSDSDGTVTARQWTQTAGTAVTLSGATTDTATFTAPPTLAGDVLTFEYEVTDDDAATSTDTCTVTVLAATERVVRAGVEVPAYIRKGS